MSYLNGSHSGMFSVDVLNNSPENTSMNNTIPVYDYTDEEWLIQIKELIQPKFYHWMFLVLFLFIFVVGIGGNFLVCFAVWKSSQLKTVTNFFLVNLAVADFLVILICLPASVIQEILQSWFLGLFMCKLTIYLQRVSIFVSVLTLTAISVERYLAICHPLAYHGTSSPMKTRVTIGFIWIIALVIPSEAFFNMVLIHDKYIPLSMRPWLTSCGPNDPQIEHYFNMMLLAVFYLVPLLIMTFTYTKIAICLWTSTVSGNAVSENLQYESAIEQLRTRRRTAKMLIVVVITFGLCYLPIYVLNIARYTNAVESIESNSAAVFCIFWTARFFSYFNSAINPVIYNFMSVKFRNQFKTACFGCYKNCGHPDSRKRPSPTSFKSHSQSAKAVRIRMTYVTRTYSKPTCA